MSDCGLSGISIARLLPRGVRGTGGTCARRTGRRRSSRRTPPPPAPPAAAAARRRRSRPKRRRRRTARVVARRDRRALEALDALERALRRTAVRMRRPVEQSPAAPRLARTPGLSRSCRIAVIVSARRFSISSVGKDGLRATSATTVEHVVEVLRQARARQRQDVTIGRDPERDAAIVERLGDRVGRSASRAAIDDAAEKPGEPGQIVRLVRGCRRGTRS